jgi:hypothetical protein
MKNVEKKSLLKQLEKISDKNLVEDITALFELYQKNTLTGADGAKAQSIIDRLFKVSNNYVIPGNFFDSELAHFLFTIKYGYEKYYSVPKVAAALNLSRSLVSRDKDYNNIVTRKFNDRYDMVSHSELLRYAELKKKEIDWSKL